MERLAALGFVDITIEETDKTGNMFAEVRAFRGPGAEAIFVPSASAA